MVTRRLDAFFRLHAKVYLDTSIFIYFLEQHPVYHESCDEVFGRLERGRIQAATSTLTLMEVLVQPYRLNKEELVLKYYSLFTTYPRLQWIELSREIADRAAELRADYRLKTPDAIHLASALSCGATGFLCNDTIFRKVKEIECLLLDTTF